MILKILDFSIKKIFKSSKKIPLFQKIQEYVFFSRISFNIGLWTYIVKYEPGIKNTWFFSKISKKKNLKRMQKIPHFKNIKNNVFIFVHTIKF
jgi:hypothetical protein